MGEAALPDRDVARLLERTSRTFALTIPLLSPDLAAQVGVAYLLLRLADTLEDAPRWGRDRRAEALASFARWLDDAGSDAWIRVASDDRPTDDAGCLELLGRASDVLARARSFAAHGPILAHTRRTVEGMHGFVVRQDPGGHLALRDLADLRGYAYVVAGIVGEMLTELFALADPCVAALRPRLAADAGAFGEGLQLVNIVKDAVADAREGRAYLPPCVPAEAIIALAREDLARAGTYVETLRTAGAAPGIVRFCDLPVRLAEATLDRLAGGGLKLTRDEVRAIVAAVTAT